ncbi:MAG: YdcF family protein [Planctomycetaceae bacterium]|nr:YdcF family protein [Planctomycetaceae bacterium]
MDSSRSNSGRPTRAPAQAVPAGSARPSRTIASHAGASRASTAQPKPPEPRATTTRTPGSRRGSSTSPRRAPASRQQNARQPRRPIQPYQGSPLPEFESAPGWLAISRGVALFLGVYLLLSLVTDMKFGIDSSRHWWSPLSPLTTQQAKGFLATCSAVLLIFSMKPNLPGPIRLLSTLLLLTWAGFLGYTTYQYYLARELGQLQTSFPVAFPLHLLAMLAVVFAGFWKTCNSSLNKGRDFLLVLFTLVLSLITFPIAQMFCYGYIEHRQQADAIAVFGCRANADGTPSPALRNRVLTGIELYQSGLAPVLILSGGSGEGEQHETMVMKQLAVEAGVPESALLIDDRGWSTSETLTNINQYFAQQAATNSSNGNKPRVLAVSDFYHLPRIQFVAERTDLDCDTVPAKDPVSLEEQALSIGREVAAFWWYQVEPFLPASAEKPLNLRSPN